VRRNEKEQDDMAKLIKIGHGRWAVELNGVRTLGTYTKARATRIAKRASR
jgi:hypothetical protein